MRNFEEDKFYNKDIGMIGEEIIYKYLINNNYKVLERNFHCKSGEIDIIAKDNDEYVFIEVKTRVSKRYGTPAEAVNINKQKHIINATKYFVYKNSLENSNIRFDVIEVYLNKKDKSINHIKNAFYTKCWIIILINF